MDTNKRMHTKPRSSSQAKRPQSRRRSASKVVYTEAKPFNRNRFILQLVTVVAVVLALLLGLSIFFKAKNFVVSGCEKYTAYQIRQATGIQEGENLLTINGARVSGKIMTKLPYVKQVRVQIKLPDTVLIEVVEVDVTYAIQAKDESWWLIDCDGKVLESVSAAEAKSYTHLIGVRLDNPEPGKKGVAEEPVPEETTPDGATVPVTVYGSERLNVLLDVLQNLEKRGILGDQVATVDVTSIGDIRLWYGQRYEVLLGNSDNLNTKIHMMSKAITQSSEYQSGVLDVSFTIRPDEVIYTPF